MNRSFLAALVSAMLLALAGGPVGASDSVATEKPESAAAGSQAKKAAKSTLDTPPTEGGRGKFMGGLFGPQGQDDSGSINRAAGDMKKAGKTIEVRQQPAETMLGELQGAQSPKVDGQGTRTSSGKQQSVATPPQQVQAQGKPTTTSAKPCKSTASVSVPPGC